MCMNMGHVMGKLKSLDSHILIIKQFHLTTLTALSKTEIKINPARKRLKIVEVCVQCWYTAYMHTIAECTWHTPNDRNDKTTVPTSCFSMPLIKAKRGVSGRGVSFRSPLVNWRRAASTWMGQTDLGWWRRVTQHLPKMEWQQKATHPNGVFFVFFWREFRFRNYIPEAWNKQIVPENWCIGRLRISFWGFPDFQGLVYLPVPMQYIYHKNQPCSYMYHHIWILWVWEKKHGNAGGIICF